MAPGTLAYYEYLPEGYDPSKSATYPLILFMPGIGQMSTGFASQIDRVLEIGLPKLIDSGIFPKSFIVNGETFKFIVITPQFDKRTDASLPQAPDMDLVLNYIVQHYKIDLNRIYITGLSYGGGLTFAYPGTSAAYAQRVAAIAPVASPVPAGGDATIVARSRVIAENNVPVWATHNERDNDDPVATTRAYIANINSPTPPNPPANMTIFQVSGHDAWTRSYDPNRKDYDGKSLYEWLLQWTRARFTVPNVPPVASAGPDQTIILPTSSAGLSGNGQDTDGSIAGYSWTKVSGPAGGTITSPTQAATTVTGLAQGTYVFRLTVTDNKGASTSDDVTIVVNPAPNAAPVVSAGPNQTITLPTSSVTLSGTATDADNNLVSVAWTKVSGGAATITSPGTAVTVVSGLSAGVYVFRLTAIDAASATAADEVTVTVSEAPNQSPTASAGADQTITLPTNTVTLTGTATDADGTIAKSSWTKVSGPGGDVLGTANTLSTTVSGLSAGSYVYRLTVTDDKNATAFDDITITVNEANNQTPTANAGNNQTITLPVNAVTLAGSGTDTDGTIAKYLWTKVSGPQGETIEKKDSAQTLVSNLTEGVYVFRLTVVDNKEAMAADDVTITVVAAPIVNKPPVSNAGTDQTITLPLNSVTLQGSASDSDGTIASYAWTLVSGPGGATITSASTPTTLVSGLTQGTYVFRLTAIDNKGASASDDITITVNAAPVNQAPQAFAGIDQSITLPLNNIVLSGTGTDADGTIAGYHWSQVSGPNSATIVGADSAKAAASNLLQGVYLFRLTVEDNDSATGTDEVMITVNPPLVNKLPVIDAGPNQAIVLPLDSVLLKGVVSDSDGTIDTYVWTQVSGPEGATISSPNSIQTTVQSLQQGSYVFLLTVMDNSGAKVSDSVHVDVTIVLAVDDPTAEAFRLLVAPNPATTYFTLKLFSSSVKPVYVRITDVLGRVVEERRNLQRNTAITVGATYRPGVYYAEVVQDGRRRVVTLLKR